MVVETTAEDVLSDVAAAEGYVAGICFKTGPPESVGLELEWIVHHADDPRRRLTSEVLARALYPHSPITLDPTSPATPLPSGDRLTVEPGGQVEISTLPRPSITALTQAVAQDVDHLTRLLSSAGLRVGAFGMDAYRTPHKILTTPRYDAMAVSLDRDNPHGRIMMCSTAGLQVCVDAGSTEAMRARWATVHDIGPAMIALFANSRRKADQDSGYASARMGTWLAMHPGRTAPVPISDDPVADWAAYAVRAPVLCVREPDGPWQVPDGVTFADWINGAIRPGPTRDDLAYHLTTLFPPVRPRGYLEIRYLDTQPGDEWIAPTALVTALLEPSALDRVREICGETAGRWFDAAVFGLEDRALAAAARDLATLGLDRLDRLGLSATDRARVTDIVDRRLAAGKASLPESSRPEEWSVSDGF